MTEDLADDEWATAHEFRRARGLPVAGATVAILSRRRGAMLRAERERITATRNAAKQWGRRSGNKGVVESRKPRRRGGDPPTLMWSAPLPTDSQGGPLYRIGAWAAETGVDAKAAMRAGRDLLCAPPPAHQRREVTAARFRERRVNRQIESFGAGDSCLRAKVLQDRGKKLRARE